MLTPQAKYQLNPLTFQNDTSCHLNYTSNGTVQTSKSSNNGIQLENGLNDIEMDDVRSIKDDSYPSLMSDNESLYDIIDTIKI